MQSQTTPGDESAEPPPASATVAEHEDREINEVVERLRIRFPEEAVDRIRTVVDAAHEQFDGNPIRDFIPVFVERAAREVLGRFSA